MLLHGAGAMFAFGRFNACFAAGTPIRTPGGSKRIEDLQVGDLLLTRDEHYPDSAVVAWPVLATMGNTTLILRLVVGEREIRTSQEHPFYVKNRGWRPAKLIQPGDELLTEAGTWTKCKAAVLTADFAPVYNIEIDEHHTYFVGEEADGSAVWAHNACEPKRGPRGGRKHTPGHRPEHIQQQAKQLGMKKKLRHQSEVDQKMQQVVEKWQNLSDEARKLLKGKRGIDPEVTKIVDLPGM